MSQILLSIAFVQLLPVVFLYTHFYQRQFLGAQFSISTGGGLGALASAPYFAWLHKAAEGPC